MKNYNDTNFITGLRFYAVFLVFLAHSAGTGFFVSYPGLLPLYYLGKYGVDIFFVISGFTIYSQLSKKNATLVDFLCIRFVRISSAYWPILGVLLIYYGIFDGAALTGWFDSSGPSLAGENIIAHFLFFGAIFPEYANNLLGVEWSLNIEIFYYLLLGFLFFHLSFNKLPKVLILLFVFFIFSVLIALFRGRLGIQDHHFLWLPFKYCYMFALGGVSFFVREYLSVKLIKPTQYIFSDLVILSCFIILIVLLNFSLYTISSFLVSFIFALVSFFLLVFVKKGSVLSPLLTSSWIVFLGSFSFSFYLIHYPMSSLLNIVDLDISSEAKLLINFLLSSIVAYIWYVIFEKRLYNGFKRKWFAKRYRLSSFTSR